MKRVLVAAIPAAMIVLAGCGSPSSFTPAGVRDEVVSAVPREWDVGTASGRDPGNCLVTCIGRATLTIDTGSDSPRDALDRALRSHGWRAAPVDTTDPATARRYPLAETYTKVFRDRDGKSGSYELIPLRNAGDTVTVQVEIDAHDLEPGER